MSTRVPNAVPASSSEPDNVWRADGFHRPSWNVEEQARPPRSTRARVGALGRRPTRAGCAVAVARGPEASPRPASRREVTEDVAAGTGPRVGARGDASRSHRPCTEQGTRVSDAPGPHGSFGVPWRTGAGHAEREDTTQASRSHRPRSAGTGREVERGAASTVPHRGVPGGGSRLARTGLRPGGRRPCRVTRGPR